MNLTWFHIDSAIPSQILGAIKKEISNAFDIDETGKFIVNPTQAYKLNQKTGKLSPAVINSAKYISGRFQGRLKDLGWAIDYKLRNQEIDGFKKFKNLQEDTYYLSEDQYHKYIKLFDISQDGYVSEIAKTYYKYYRSKSFTLEDPSKSNFFTNFRDSSDLAIGLEFETGNIASSFRAISKLNYLVEIGQIDIGVFITSVDKATSTKIWPSSNRNGSIEELKNRKFMNSILFPSIIVGFTPDEWSNDAGYLSAQKERFFLGENPSIKIIQGQSYDFHTEGEYYIANNTHNFPTL